jgi:hypothetical protein
MNIQTDRRIETNVPAQPALSRLLQSQPNDWCILHQSFIGLQRGKAPRGLRVNLLLSREVSGTVTPGQSKMVFQAPALIPPEKKFSDATWRPVPPSVLAGLVCFLGVGCTSSPDFPSMGEPLPYTARLEIAREITSLTAEYTDSCGQPLQLSVGSRLEEALREGANRTFKAVVYEGDERNGSPPDLLLKIDLLGWSFDLDKDALYDRAPIILQLNALARVYDAKGAVMRETEIQVDKRDRLRLEQLAKNCNYVIAPFIQTTAVEFASKLFQDAKLAFHERQGPQPVAQAPATSPGLPPPGSPPMFPPALAGPAPFASSLRFKAMLLDENGNLVLEAGEHVRVRVDVINTGSSPIQNASASLTGTPVIIGQFPATILAIPPLQPGETKSLEFVATLPPTVQPQRAEIHVAVTEPDGKTAAPSQTLSLTIEPSAAGTDDVDQIPFPTAKFHRPQTYLVSIGVGAHREAQIEPRKYAAADAKMVAAYFRSLGGIPPSNIRLLHDRKAFRYDIDEALFDWLPSTAAKDAVVIVYFSGQAMVDQTGEVLLVTYEGSPTVPALLYPLKEVESALSLLKTKQVILLFDVRVSKLQGDSGVKPVGPSWTLAGTNTIGVISGEGFAKGLEDDQHRHGLFTYYLLRGLRGDADTNRDRAVTLGELAGYIRQKVAWAAKSRFNTEQRPQILPVLKPGDKAATLVLSRLAALSGAEAP